MNTQNIKLDISKESPGYPIVRIGQGDSSGTTIRATVYDNGSTPTLTGMTVKMHMRLPDGKSYAEGGNCSVNGNVITCVVDESRFAVVDGYTNDAYFSLTTGTTIYSTSRFRVKVEKAASKDADPAGMYTDDVVAATTAAREAADAATEAIEQIGTAVDDAQQAAEDAAQAVTDAQTAILDADAAKQSATTAANQATAAANNANSKANLANTAANNANAATSAANDATTRANAAIDAMGDISEQAVPVMSADVRGGAKIQPNSGLEIDGTDNLQVRLALESEGDVRGGILGLTAKGHAEQVQTTGKNLLPMFSSSTSNGITLSVAEDGTCTLNGTASGNANFQIVLDIEPGTYTLSVNNETTIGSGFSNSPYMFISMSDNAWANQLATNYANAKNTATPNIKLIRATLVVPGGVTVTNFKLRPQLELGSTATDYEPYSGGAPSPSPDYPQEIRVARGRNLLNLTMQVNGTNVVIAHATNVSVNDQILTMTASNSNPWFGEVTAAGSSWSAEKGTLIEVEGGASYVLSQETTVFSQVYVTEYDASKVSLGYFQRYNKNSFTTLPNARYVSLRIGSNTTSAGSVLSGRIQLELGSTHTPYVPYGYVGMETQGKNLLDTSQLVMGSVDSNGNLTATTTNYARTPKISVEPNTEYVAHTTYAANAQLLIAEWADNGTYLGLSSYSKTDRATSAPFVTKPTTAQVVVIFRHVSTPAVLADFAESQLELGSTATRYEPYYHTTTPIPLPQRGWVGSLPDGTADVLTLDGAGKCKWTCVEGKLTVDDTLIVSGSAPSAPTGSASGYRVALAQRISDALSSTATSDAVNIFVSHFRASTDALDNTKWRIGEAMMYMRNIYFVTEHSTGAAVSAWFNANPVTVLYPLATPVTEDCGYCEDWPTDIPDGATVTISELDSVGIKYFIDSGVTELARQWYEHAHSEYEDRLEALEAAVAELVTEA